MGSIFFIRNQQIKAKKRIIQIIDKKKEVIFKSNVSFRDELLDLNGAYLSYRLKTKKIKGWLKSIFFIRSNECEARIIYRERLVILNTKLTIIENLIEESEKIEKDSSFPKSSSDSDLVVKELSYKKLFFPINCRSDKITANQKSLQYVNKLRK